MKKRQQLDFSRVLVMSLVCLEEGTVHDLGYNQINLSLTDSNLHISSSNCSLLVFQDFQCFETELADNSHPFASKLDLPFTELQCKKHQMKIMKKWRFHNAKRRCVLQNSDRRSSAK